MQSFFLINHKLSSPESSSGILNDEQNKQRILNTNYFGFVFPASTGFGFPLGRVVICGAFGSVAEGEGLARGTCCIGCEVGLDAMVTGCIDCEMGLDPMLTGCIGCDAEPASITTGCGTTVTGCRLVG